MKSRGWQVASVALSLLGAAVAASSASCSSSSSNTGFGGGDNNNDNGDGGGFFGGGDSGLPCIPDPANYDFPDNNCDDDGDGKVDNAPAACDTGLTAAGGATDFAKAIGLCQTASGPNDTKWGLISASFSNGYGRADAPNDAQHGIVPKFGNSLVPREGKSLGILSTGFAREFDSATGTTQNFKLDGEPMQRSGGFPPTPVEGRVPPGFPKPAQGCEINNKVYDTIVLKLQIKAPPNAKGMAFDFNFHSGEWPEYVCTQYNDGFIAYLRSTGFNGGAADNISFDSKSNPVSVNNGFFDRCTPNIRTGRATGANGVEKTSVCSGGPNELGGTGFGQPLGQFPAGNGQSTPGGATGWLTSTAPIQPGEVIEVQFIIWDTGDANFDSSVLIDNFRWVAGQTQTGTVRPPK